MKSIIPKGYRVIISTWENDADNYKNAIVEGLNKEQLIFLHKLCNLFTSHNSGDKKGIGNIYSDMSYRRDDRIKNAINVLESFLQIYFPDFSLANKDEDEEDFDLIEAKIEEKIGTTLQELELLFSEDFVTRVFDKMTIQFIKEDIQFETVDIIDIIYK